MSRNQNEKKRLFFPDCNTIIQKKITTLSLLKKSLSNQCYLLKKSVQETNSQN